MSDIEEAARQQKQMSSTTKGPAKWLGQVFQVSKQPMNNRLFADNNNSVGISVAEPQDKTLIFAGITDTHKKPGIVGSLKATSH